MIFTLEWLVVSTFPIIFRKSRHIDYYDGSADFHGINIGHFYIGLLDAYERDGNALIEKAIYWGTDPATRKTLIRDIRE